MQATAPRLLWSTFVITALSALILVGVALSAKMMFGSMSSAIAYCRGFRCIIGPEEIDLGTIPVGGSTTAKFKAQNFAGHRITIVGARVSCSCIGVNIFPVHLEPGEERDLSFEVRHARDKVFRHIIAIHTDLPSHAVSAVVIRGHNEDG